jgi:hypothetical protein
MEASSGSSTRGFGVDEDMVTGGVATGAEAVTAADGATALAAGAGSIGAGAVVDAAAGVVGGVAPPHPASNAASTLAARQTLMSWGSLRMNLCLS